MRSTRSFPPPPGSSFGPLPLLPNPLDALPAAINHLIAAEPWARAQLKPHLNKTLHVVMPPFTVRLAVAPDGTVARGSATAPADTTVTLAWSAVPRAMAGDGDALTRDMRLEGDADFAQAVSLLVRNLRWNVEEDLSKVVGDVAAHRVVATARRADGEIRRAGQKVAAGITEYLLEEDPQLVRPRQVRELAEGIRALRDDLARLDKRIDRLAAGVGPQA